MNADDVDLLILDAVDKVKKTNHRQSFDKHVTEIKI
jgi:hypothetical protein